MIKTSIKAILFDLDGVLVDACDWHYHALNGALKKNCGITINRKDHEETFNGIPTKKKLEILEGRKLILRESFEKIWSDKQEYTKQAIENFASKDLEKISMHETLRDMGFVIGCVTNSIRETATLMLSKTGQYDFMQILITNEDVTKPKPDSECYRKAMEEFDVQPEETLIIEDSEKGYIAATNSKAYVLKVKDFTEVNLKSVLDKIKLISGE